MRSVVAVNARLGLLREGTEPEDQKRRTTDTQKIRKGTERTERNLALKSPNEKILVVKFKSDIISCEL
jgi:hypothetical protein